MGRPIEPCAWCGSKVRPASMRKRMRDPETGKQLRVAACHSCKGVPGLDVPDRWKQGVRSRSVDVLDPDSYRAWSGDHHLAVGDCRELMDGARDVQLWLTDPPYNIGYEYEGYNDDMPWAEYVALMATVAAKAFKATRGGGLFRAYPLP